MSRRCWCCICIISNLFICFLSLCVVILRLVFVRASLAWWSGMVADVAAPKRHHHGGWVSRRATPGLGVLAPRAIAHRRDPASDCDLRHPGISASIGTPTMDLAGDCSVPLWPPSTPRATSFFLCPMAHSPTPIHNMSSPNPGLAAGYLVSIDRRILHFAVLPGNVGTRSPLRWCRRLPSRPKRPACLIETCADNSCPAVYVTCHCLTKACMLEAGVKEPEPTCPSRLARLSQGFIPFQSHYLSSSHSPPASFSSRPSKSGKSIFYSIYH